MWKFSQVEMENKGLKRFTGRNQLNLTYLFVKNKAPPICQKWKL